MKLEEYSTQKLVPVGLSAASKKFVVCSCVGDGSCCQVGSVSVDLNGVLEQRQKAGQLVNLIFIDSDAVLIFWNIWS